MMCIKHTCVIGIIAMYFGLAFTGPASTQTYPSRPITIIVPFPPGNNADIVARFLADRLGASLGQSVIVDHRSGGAGGTITPDQ